MLGWDLVYTASQLRKIYNDLLSSGIKVRMTRTLKRKYGDLFNKEGKVKTLQEFSKGYGPYASDDYKFKLFKMYEEAALQGAKQGKTEAVEKSMNKLIEDANKRSEKYNEWLTTLGERVRGKSSGDEDGLPKLGEVRLENLSAKAMERRIKYKVKALNNRLAKGVYEGFKGNEGERRKRFTGTRKMKLSEAGSYVNMIYNNYLYVARTYNRNVLVEILYQLTPEQAIAAFDGAPSIIYSLFYASESNFYYGKLFPESEYNIITAILEQLDAMGVKVRVPPEYEDLEEYVQVD